MPKDLDESAGTIRVVHGKGDQARTVGLDPDGFAYLSRWLDRRQRLGLNGAVFCTLQGGYIKQPYIRSLLPRLAAKAGIDKRVHAHGLRHTHAAELARERLPVNLIQRQLGHSNLGVTSRYLDHVAPQDLVEALQGRRWE